MPAYIFTLLLLSVTMGMAHASYQGSGKATLTGEIVEAACSIATDDVWQEINFGAVPLSDFADGNEPAGKPFHIRLQNCVLDKASGGIWQDVIVTFDGNTQSNQHDMFSMTGDGQGIGVKITDETGHKVIPGQPLPSVQLYEDNTNLHFNIHLARNNENLTSGNLSSYIRFMVAYQ
ncbi:TPA: type 1 fimbrial protein [Enterobacter cloacae]|uniref:fimbrial protein n=1 Tax=Enterobacter cloacae TaxID=550 RepID=UPI0015963C06|nr:fimbrial protein [Enterobacter cloacae]HAS1065192.1 type 1 fimbrial protein [Enterobacter cloacae]HAS1098103.1 type 1 fimbrial protein [Enterobacter cloacae]